VEDRNFPIESRTNYWTEFYQTHPDLGPLESIVATHPGLVKIFNFCFVSSIWENIRQYPFDNKIAELKTISQKDKEYLSDKHMEPGPNQEWFDYLDSLFQLVTATVRRKEKLDSKNVELGGKYSQGEILKILESDFHRFISVNETVVFKEKSGIQKTVMATGRFWPVRFRIFIEILNRNLGTVESIFQEHYECPPTEADIAATLDDLDRYSVVSLQKHGKGLHDICWGGFHPDLDKSNHRQPIQPEQHKHIVELYYKGKRLAKPFVFPIRKRYLGLIKKVVKETIQKYHNRLGEKEDLQAEAEARLFDACLKFDETLGVPPPAYFSGPWGFEHFASHLYEERSTTSSKVLEIDCDPDCKREKDLENKLPCEFETPDGHYCKDPERQRKQRLKAEIDESGGSLDVFIDEDETTYRIETIEDEAFDIKAFLEQIIPKGQMLNRLNKEERELYRTYYQDERTQTELAQILGVHQSTVSRRIRELNNKIAKIIGT